MFPFKSDKSLQDVLQGKSVLWHPAWKDSNSDFLELQIGMRECDKKIGITPDVILLTDDRMESDSIPTFGTVFELPNNALVQRMTVGKIYEHTRLQNLHGYIGASELYERNQGNLGRVLECQCECETIGFGSRSVTVIFVVAESVEFMFSVLLPNRLSVDVIYQENYYKGFNCCRTDGVWLRRAASVLGAKWYYTDKKGLRDFIMPDYDEVFKVYPSLLGFKKQDLVSLDIEFDTTYRPAEAAAHCYRVMDS